MRAIVLMTGQMGEGLFAGDRNPVSLLWLVDRPFVQRICEGLVGQGVKTIDWVHQHANGPTVHLLGDGRRWGARFAHHHVERNESVYSRIRTLASAHEPDSALLVGHANRFFDFSACSVDARGGDSVRLFDSVGHGTAWTGWARLNGRVASAIPNSVSNPSEFESYLCGANEGSTLRESLPRGYAVHSVDSYLQATREILLAEYAHETVRVPRSARVHRTARLVGPVCIGAGAEVGAHVVIGPNVVVGPNSIVDRKAVVANSVILPFSYVGRDLRLNQAVVDRNRVLGPASGGHALVDDRAPVACLASRPFSRVTPTAIAASTVGLLQKVSTLPTRIFRKRPRFLASTHAGTTVIPAVAN